MLLSGSGVHVSLTPCRLINTWLRKSQTGSQNVIGMRALSPSSDTVAIAWRICELCYQPIKKLREAGQLLIKFGELTLEESFYVH